MSEETVSLDDPIPQCNEINCSREAELYLPVNDGELGVIFNLCAAHWQMLDDGLEMELIDDATGNQYKLKFDKPDGTMGYEPSVPPLG